MNKRIWVVLAAVFLGCGSVWGAKGTLSEQIMVDQFGWRPGDHKVVIFANAIKGQGSHYQPGKAFEIRKVADDGVAFSGNVVAWHDGATDDVSGDQTWEGDFSGLATPGDYYVFDPEHQARSFPFRIGPGVYDNVLKAAMRMYYYQRTGTEIPVKFGGNWHHAIDHVGPGQDKQIKLWKDGKPVPNSETRDLSGGWFDAGDFNKYVPFTQTVLWNLLTAYEWNPQAFKDDSNIPESGNGVPDELDEIKYELDFLLKMQNPDGSVLNRDSNPTYAAGHADPSTDTQPRYYTQATTWATASFAASIGHAARVFAKFDSVYPKYSRKLQDAAEKAWGFLESHPKMWPEDGTDHGKGLASAPGDGSASMDLQLRVLAAAELFKTTGKAEYGKYFADNCKNPGTAEAGGFQPLVGNWLHFDASQAIDLEHGLITYATTPGANAGIVKEIKTSLGNFIDGNVINAYDQKTDPYGAFMFTGHYCWGSNQIKGSWGGLLLATIKLKVSPANDKKFREAAEQYAHYFHGQNPLSLVYLSNMGPRGANLGAGKSPMTFFHSWFSHGSKLYDGPDSKYGTAPGYVVGGPNQFYKAGGGKVLSPPMNQPPMKSFFAFSDSSPLNSWEVTEPAIYYQAAYVFLLSGFCDGEKGN